MKKIIFLIAPLLLTGCFTFNYGHTGKTLGWKYSYENGNISVSFECNPTPEIKKVDLGIDPKKLALYGKVTSGTVVVSALLFETIHNACAQDNQDNK